MNLSELGETLRAFWRSRRAAIGRGVATLLPVIVVWLVFVVSGLRGIDFGFHWDEVESHVGPTRNMVASGVLLPRTYTYPMLTKWLILLPALPAGIPSLARGEDPAVAQAAILTAMDAPTYLLGLRRLFLCVTSLSILFVYAAALTFGHRRWQALLAAAGMGLSWEFAYHARFVVPDGILVTFSALTLLGLALHHRSKRPGWLYALAVLAGLGTGTKYPGVFLLVPILLASALALPARAVFRQLARAALLCAIAFAVYLVTTPATALDPFLFLRGAKEISRYYAHERHGGYTVDTASEHAKLLFEYLALDYFSPYRVVSIGLFLASVAGGVLWLRREVRLGLVLLILPVGFACFFCIRYRLVTVRNYLFFVPFLAVLLARTGADLEALLRFRWLRRLLGGGLAALGLLQANWLGAAAESIRRADPRASARRAIAYVRAHSERRFRVSGQVRSLGLSPGALPPENVTDGKADSVVFFQRAEGPNAWDWKTNDPYLTEAVFGPREVNVNWYASWAGSDHVVVMTFEKAKATGAPITR